MTTAAAKAKATGLSKYPTARAINTSVSPALEWKAYWEAVGIVFSNIGIGLLVYLAL